VDKKGIPMAKHNIKWFIHDSYETSESFEYLADQTGLSYDDVEASFKDGFPEPFYEVGFTAVYDDAAGTITDIKCVTYPS
jgi:hypothetical protein